MRTPQLEEAIPQEVDGSSSTSTLELASQFNVNPRWVWKVLHTNLLYL